MYVIYMKCFKYVGYLHSYDAFDVIIYVFIYLLINVLADYKDSRGIKRSYISKERRSIKISSV